MAIEAHAANRQRWDEVTPVHVVSRFYDVAGFLAGRCTVGPVERGAVGDVRGRRLLHLQCHFGLDTLSWARLGADVVGVDFSAPALAEARRLAARIGLADRARFVESDVLELALGERFDVVFTSHGTIGWLSDLGRWGQVVARHLSPGGVFYVLDAHPTALMFAADDDGGLRLAYEYVHRDDPYIKAVPDFAEPGYVPRSPEHSWSWPLVDVAGALERAGLCVFEFREYPFAAWPMFPGMEPDDGGDYWHPPPEGFRLPLMFALKARWP
jgi:SAM-dependent methyltransferase